MSVSCATALYAAFICSCLCEMAICLELSFTLEVAPDVRDCMHQYMAKDTPYEVSYQVIEGSEMVINFIAQAPSGDIVLTDIRKTSNLQKLKATETGDFAFCLDNNFSHFSKKVVFFELFVDIEDEEDDDAKLLSSIDSADYEYKLEDFQDNVDRIRDNLHKSIQIQKLFSAIESRDRSIIEYNFERVNFWSAIQLVAMVTAAAVNVLVIRNLFYDKRSETSATKMRT